MINSKEEIYSLIDQHKQKIIGFGVNSLGLFGSFKSGNFNSDSDIDLVVEFKDGYKTYNNYIQLVFFFEEIFGRKVELLTPKSMSIHIKPHIERNIEYVALAS